MFDAFVCARPVFLQLSCLIFRQVALHVLVHSRRAQVGSNTVHNHQRVVYSVEWNSAVLLEEPDSESVGLLVELEVAALVA